MAARFGNGQNDRRPFDAFQRTQLFLKALEAREGHRKFLHVASSKGVRVKQERRGPEFP